MSIEGYDEFQKRMNSLSKEERILLILQTFQSMLGANVGLLLDKNAANSFIFGFRDQFLYDDMVNEITLILTEPDKNPATIEDALDLVAGYMESYRKAPRLCSVMMALSKEIRERVGITKIPNDYHNECCVLIKDEALYEYIISQKFVEEE
jgi:hypothetical protein